MLKFDKDKVYLVSADSDGRAKMRKNIESKYAFYDNITVAKSILSRDVEAYHIGKGKACIAIFAAHHSLESITTNLAFLLIDTLLKKSVEGTIKDVDCKLLLSKYSFWIVPCVNPDGVEMRFHGPDKSPLSDRQKRISGGDFSSWQANARGVDLNHNYAYRFDEYKQLESELGISAGPSLFSGEYPLSEPECRGVVNLIHSLMPIAVVSLHSQGEEIYAYPNNSRVQRCARRLSAMTGYSLSTPDGTASYGGLCDYTATLAIPSFTYEIGKGHNPLPEAEVFEIFSGIGESIILLPTLL